MTERRLEAASGDCEDTKIEKYMKLTLDLEKYTECESFRVRI